VGPEVLPDATLAEEQQGVRRWGKLHLRGVAGRWEWLRNGEHHQERHRTRVFDG